MTKPYEKGRTLRKWKERKEKYFIDRLFPPMLADDIKNASFSNLPDLDFDNGEGIYIHGELETGKTVLAGKIMLEERKRLWVNSNHTREEFLFKTTTELFLELKRSFSDDTDITEPEVTERYQNAYLLVLDDFGVFGKPSEWLIMVLYSIINYRMQHRRPTIYTSNYTLSEVAELIGDERITSRIKRSCKIAHKRPWKNQAK